MARLPEVKSRRLHGFGRGTGHIDHCRIHIGVDVHGRRHSAAALGELAAIEIKPSPVVGCVYEPLKSGNDNLTGREASRECIRAIELKSETLFGPDGKTQPA